MPAWRRICWILFGPLLTAVTANGCAASLPRAEGPPPPEALGALLRRIPDVASDDAGISNDKHALAKDIQAFARTAVPHVIALLHSDTLRIRRFAGYVLRDIEGLTDKDLDELIAARKRGDGWIPPAIARIGSLRAVQFLVDDLRAQPESRTQVTYALELAGTRAAVPLAHVFESADTVSEQLASAICDVLHSMAENAAPALDVLVARSRLTQGPFENRLSAIRELGCIGPAARPAISSLEAVAASEPDRLGKAVNDAILAIGSPEAVPLFIAALREHPSVALLRDIAQMREGARDVGPAVMDLFTSSKLEIRVAAVRTLGFIGYNGDPAPLVQLLADKDDWQVVNVAAESLGRLSLPAVLPALDEVAMTHWYPPVRDSARRAASVIRGSEQYPAPKVVKNFASEYFNYENIHFAHAVKRPAFIRGSNELSPRELSALAYDAETNVGLRTATGFLVGSNRGEWGGELMYLKDKSAPVRLLKENIRGIHQLPMGIVVVTGLTHLVLNHGALYLAKVVGPDKYEVSYWKTLPGAPLASGMMGDGSLFVSCVGGDIVLKAEGRLEMARASP